jgi:ammonia channel protein AmtB
MLRDLPHPELVSSNDVALMCKLFQKDKNDFRPNNIGVIVLGTFILQVCWLFFNSGSTQKMAMLDD